jgi:hypothetical protein
MKKMKNPWARKNPFLSMWLSGANAVAGVARNRIMAESKRQAATMVTQSTKQMTEFWTDAMLPQRPKKKRKKRR